MVTLFRSFFRLVVWLFYTVVELASYFRNLYKTPPPAQGGNARTRPNRIFTLPSTRVRKMRRFEPRDSSGGFFVCTSVDVVTYGREHRYTRSMLNYDTHRSRVAWRRYTTSGNRQYGYICGDTANESFSLGMPRTLLVSFDRTNNPKPLGRDQEIQAILFEVHEINERIALARGSYIYPVITDPVPLQPKPEFVDSILRLPPPAEG